MSEQLGTHFPPGEDGDPHQEREARKFLQDFVDSRAREPWEPYLLEGEAILIERVLLVMASTLIAIETGDGEMKDLGRRQLAELRAAFGGFRPLLDALTVLGPRMNLLAVRMVEGKSKGLFEVPF